jgi:hypothetical protein
MIYSFKVFLKTRIEWCTQVENLFSFFKPTWKRFFKRRLLISLVSTLKYTCIWPFCLVCPKYVSHSPKSKHLSPKCDNFIMGWQILINKVSLESLDQCGQFPIKMLTEFAHYQGLICILLPLSCQFCQLISRQMHSSQSAICNDI